MSMRSKFRPTGKPRDTHEAVARLQREVATAFDALYVDLNAVQAAGAACCEANEEAIDDLAEPGAIDHGGLGGLGDDDHPHYALRVRDMIAGAGLTGGGDLSADRTFNVGAGAGITVNADSIEVDASGIDHGGLSGLGDNDHPQYALAATTMTAGAGLTGGGDLSANRTFDVGAGTGITVNANDIEVDFSVVSALNHASRHQNGGADEIDVTGLSGLLADAQTPLAHASSHSDGGADEIVVEDLATASTTTTHVLSPDGAGGLVMRAETAPPASYLHLETLETPVLLSGTTRITTAGGGNTTPLMVLDNAASEGGVWQLRLHPLWTGGTITVQWMYAPSGTSGGSMVFDAAIDRQQDNVYRLDAADSFDASPPTHTHAVGSTQGLVSYGLISITPGGTGGDDGAQPGDFVRLRLRRLGSHASDTNTDACWMRPDIAIYYEVGFP